MMALAMDDGTPVKDDDTKPKGKIRSDKTTWPATYESWRLIDDDRFFKYKNGDTYYMLNTFHVLTIDGTIINAVIKLPNKGEVELCNSEEYELNWKDGVLTGFTIPDDAFEEKVEESYVCLKCNVKSINQRVWLDTEDKKCVQCVNCGEMIYIAKSEDAFKVEGKPPLEIVMGDEPAKIVEPLHFPDVIPVATRDNIIFEKKVKLKISDLPERQMSINIDDFDFGDDTFTDAVRGIPQKMDRIIFLLSQHREIEAMDLAESVKEAVQSQLDKEGE